MDIRTILKEIFSIEDSFRETLLAFGIQVGIFAALVLLSVSIGQLLPSSISFLVRRLAPQAVVKEYDRFATTLRRPQATAGMLILMAFSLNVLQDYAGLFQLLRFFIYLALVCALAWLASTILKQTLRTYGVNFFKRMGLNATDPVMILETSGNTVIGIFAVILFAQSQSLNLVSLLTGLGIGGLAVAFAAKEVLSQIIGSIVLYLDKPFLPGEYVRINFNIRDEDVYGRIESIGFRSTKIRVAVKNTLVIAPNSDLASKDIENISRGTKVMALLCIDFPRVLNESDRPLVEQIVTENITDMFGVEPGSETVRLFEPDTGGTRARASFFLLGSGQRVISIRKRLVEAAQESIAKQLNFQGLEFSMDEPILYLDSPVTL